MSTTTRATGRTPTPRLLRAVFALAAVGMTAQWIDRLSRVLAGESAGWRLAWDIAALGLLPLGVGYFAVRALSSGQRAAEPGAAADGGG